MRVRTPGADGWGSPDLPPNPLPKRRGSYRHGRLVHDAVDQFQGVLPIGFQDERDALGTCLLPRLKAERARFELLRTYHTSSSEVGKVAANANTKHLVLSHVLRSQGDQSAFDDDIEPHYGGKLTLGEDLMTFEV